MISDTSIPLFLADGDGVATIVIFVIIAAISLIQKGVEYLKNKKEEGSIYSSGDEREAGETAHERQIREIIKSLEWNKKAEQEAMPRKQAYNEPAPAPAMAKAAAVGREAVVVEPVPERQTVMQQAAVGMSQIVNPIDGAQYGLSGLSDAERAALERLKQGAAFAAPVPERQVVPNRQSLSGAGLDSLREGLAHPSTLQAAILYHEILGKPVALRDA